MAQSLENTELQNVSTRKIYQGDGALVLDHERGDAPNDEGDADAAADALARG